MTPAMIDKIIRENPNGICEIEHRLNGKRVIPGRNDSDFQPYKKQMERITAGHAAKGKLASVPVNWYGGNKQAVKVKI